MLPNEGRGNFVASVVLRRHAILSEARALEERSDEREDLHHPDTEAGRSQADPSIYQLRTVTSSGR
jgi:hypothetical protein